MFCASHKALGHHESHQHIALDPFQLSVWDSCGLEAVERAGLSGFLDFRATYSAMELPKLLTEGQRLDLIYVDGSHLFEDVFVDAYFSSRLLNQGGVIAFDDSSDAHVAKVLGFLRRNVCGLQEIDVNRRHNPLLYMAARKLGRLQMTAFKRIGRMDRDWNAPFRRF